MGWSVSGVIVWFAPLPNKWKIAGLILEEDTNPVGVLSGRPSNIKTVPNQTCGATSCGGAGEHRYIKAGVLADDKLDRSTYTVFLSWRINFEENSLRTSRKAKFIGGNSGPRGFWYLNANSIPSLTQWKDNREEKQWEMTIKKATQSYTSTTTLQTFGVYNKDSFNLSLPWLIINGVFFVLT